MRIIAGKAKGRKLLSPKNQGRTTVTGELEATRPTLDRVKEAMFNIIQHKVPGARVLDMFAGTGSLGLEAASRGAAQVLLVERYQETYAILNENIHQLSLGDVARSRKGDAYEVLQRLRLDGERFDIIFVDPPYLNKMVDRALEAIEQAGLLATRGVVVAKFDTSETVPESQGGMVLVDRRKYGKTLLGFYQWKIEGEV